MKTSFYLASTNIQKSEDAELFADAIAKIRSLADGQPSVWAFQELFHLATPRMKDALGDDWRIQRDRYPEGRPYENSTGLAWNSTEWKRLDGGTETIYHPPVDGPYEVYKGVKKTAWRRHASWATLQNRKTEEIFSFISVHGKLGVVGRRRQWNNLLRLQRRLEKIGQVVVLGDFNDRDKKMIGRMQDKDGFKLLLDGGIDLAYGTEGVKTIKRTLVLTRQEINSPKTLVDHPALLLRVETKSTEEPTAPTRMKLLVWNILGASHTDPANGEHYTRRYKPWDERIDKQVEIIEDANPDLFYLSECQGPQLKELKKRLPDYSWYSIQDNVLVYRTTDFTAAIKKSLSIPYFHGKTKRMPVLTLTHSTGQELTVSGLHLPADARGPALKHRDDAWEAIANRMAKEPGTLVLLGDFNELLDTVARRLRLMRTGLQIVSGTKVDFIILPKNMRFLRKKLIRKAFTSRASDHSAASVLAVLAEK